MSVWRIDNPERFIQQIRWTCEEANSGCWIWPSCSNWQSGVRPALNIKGKSMSIARWILWAVTGELQEMARHTCDVECCCNPDHLVWGTRLDNARDLVERHPGIQGRKGENNSRSILTENEVKEVREVCVPGSKEFGFIALGKKYGVSRTAIWNVFTRRTWNHI